MEEQQFGFERLDVWKRAVDFAGFVYRVTREFPKDERFGLTNQLRRAGVSVAANIAEGSSRFSGKDQSRFFEIAYGSLNEIATMFHIAFGQQFVQKADLLSARGEISEMGRMLCDLRRKALG